MAEPKSQRPRLLRSTTRLTEQTTAQFVELIKKGLPLDGCCDFLTISGEAFWNWMRKGTMYLADNEPSEYEPYGRFVAAIKKATAEYRIDRLESLHRAGNRNWFRDLAILERRDRRSFGRWEPQGGTDDTTDKDEKFI